MNMNDYFQAGRESTSEHTLHMLSHSSCPKVRSRVAENPQTSAPTLEHLSQDLNVEVRIGLGNNRNTPIHILWQLALDEHLDVRFNLADNANTTPLILAWLSADDNPYIAQRANKTIHALRTLETKSHHTGANTMAAKTVERTLRRMLSTKERLNKTNALQLRHLILEDGFLSKSEKKVVQFAINNDLLDDSAFESFLDLLLDGQTREQQDKAIA